MNLRGQRNLNETDEYLNILKNGNVLIEIFTPDKYNNTDDSPYLQRIRELPDNSFNLGSIDGRLRSKSLIISADKIMSGGHLLLDNSDRVEYIFRGNGTPRRI